MFLLYAFSVQAAVEASQTLQTPAVGFDVTPFVSLEAFTDSRECFTESGTGFAAKLSEASQLTFGYQGEFVGRDDNHSVLVLK